MRNQRILGHFNESADLKKRAADVLAEPIANAADLMFSVLTQGNKILASVMAVLLPIASILPRNWWDGSKRKDCHCLRWH